MEFLADHYIHIIAVCIALYWWLKLLQKINTIMENTKEKTTCYQCKFRGEVPGSCHSRCNRNWNEATNEKPHGHERGKKMGWFMWPYNYDPVWMIGQCKEFQSK